MLAMLAMLTLLALLTMLAMLVMLALKCLSCPAREQRTVSYLKFFLQQKSRFLIETGEMKIDQSGR